MKRSIFIIGLTLILLFGPLFFLNEFVLASNYKLFLVEKVFGDKLLVSDTTSQYIIDYGYGCTSIDFSEGKAIYLESYLSPISGNSIIVDGFLGKKTCAITSSEEVNLKQYFVVSIVGNKDEIIVEDKLGTQYLVEYGIGCLSMWRYEGKYIDIDIGGAFLNGISDRIYLFNSDDDCKVWDAEELSSSGSSGSYPSTDLQNLNESLINELLKSACPVNSQYLNGQCVCNDGYEASGNACITYTQGCQNKYGSSSYGDKQHCYCSFGYEFNSDQTACIKSIVCPSNSTKIGTQCICNGGYLMRNNTCITHTEDCIQNFGPNVLGVKGDGNNSSCFCMNSYEWNLSQTACILFQTPTPTPTPTSTITPTLAPTPTPMPILMTPTPTPISTPQPNFNIPEGALIRAKGDADIYIVKYIGSKKFKRLILSPVVFNSYGHLRWSDVVDVEKSVVDSFTTSDLVRATVAGDPRVYKLYPSGDTGEKRWIKTAETFNALGYDWDAIYTINEIDRNSYIEGKSLE